MSTPFPTAQAQSADDRQLLPTARFTHLTTEDGLAQNNVQAILQDRQGFLWFGTSDGLSRFDGYNFVTFKHNPDQSNSLPGNLVTDLAEDAEGMIWITTAEGASRFDPRHETFTNFAGDSSSRKLLDTVLMSIDIDPRGDLWFGGPPGVGLLHYDSTTGEVTQFHAAPSSDAVPPGSVVAAPWGIVGQSVEDSQGQRWLVTETGLFRYDASNNQFQAYSILATYPGEGRLNALLPDNNGGLWVGGASGLYHFDPQQPKFSQVPNLPGEIESLFRDREGLVWLATNSGLYRFDEVSQNLLPPFQHDPLQPFSLSRNRVNTIYQDQAGLFWIGTAGGGVDSFSPSENQFVRYSYDPLHPQKLAGLEVSSLALDAQSLWLTSDIVLHQIDLASKQVKQFPLPIMAHDNVRALLRDHTGKFWIGTRLHRLFEFDPNRAQFVEHDLIVDSDLPHTGPPPEIAALVEDRQGNVWVVINWVGLYRLAATDHSIRRFVPSGLPGAFGDDPTTVARGDVTALTLAADGTLWLGYVDGSLSHIDPQTLHFQHFQAQSDFTRRAPFAPPGAPPPDCENCPPPPGMPPPKSLASTGGQTSAKPADALRPSAAPVSTIQNGLGGWIETLFVDRQGAVWIGTRNGLLRFDAGSGMAKRYSEQTGLPSNHIVSIAEDETGLLWVGTKKGLARFDPLQETVRNFDVSDGLQSNEFLPNAVTKAADGTFYWGGSNGLTVFNPSAISNQESDSSPVLLTQLRLFNLPVPIGGESTLQQAIWATDHLTLQPTDQIVSFEFSSLSYRAPQKIRYRYKLDGLEKEWNEVDSQRRFATYTSLPAGNYTFRVQGTNSDGVWNKQEVALSLTVMPAWWQRLWVRGLALVCVLLLGFAANAYRVRAIEKRNRLLEAQVKERTQELSESEARFRGLATSTFEALLVHERGKLLDANQAAEEMFGYSHEALLGRSLADLLPTLPAEVPHTKTESGIEVQGVTETGEKLALEMRSRQVPFQGRDATVVTLHNLSERKQIETQQRQVAAFQERERIGRDLHDNLGQVMGYMSVQAQTVSDLLEQSKEGQAQAALKQLVKAAQAAHSDIRKYILNIRTPASESPLRLLEALQLFLEQVQERHGLTVELSLPHDLPNDLLALEAEEQLLRIIQEAINNIQKHAGVQRARVTFTLHSDELQVLIADDGQGFDLSIAHRTPPSLPAHNGSAPAIPNPTHFGLSIMRERAEGIGGTLELRSKPGAGTQVIVRLPRLVRLSHRLAPADEIRGLRLLLVDDHPLYVEGLRNLLSARGIQVVGTAHNGTEALQLTRKHLPDLVLMDIEMPHGNGIDATRSIKSEFPQVKIVMLTMAASEETLFEALKQGASGYLLKSLDANQLFELLREVMRGEIVLSPQLASKVLATFAQPSTLVPNASATPPIATPVEAKPSAPPETAQPVGSTLTYRQHEVLELVAQGLSNKEIAQRLDITERTVKFHVGLILESLQLRSRYELAQVADRIRK
ncbi:MAG: two-component regulator propeller domain-containing protein [Caldilineaceae bacterium]